VHVLNDGYEGWVAARRHTTTRATARAPLRIKLTPNPKLIATTEKSSRTSASPAVQFVDVRRPSEWSGEESETLQGGHLPGAVLIPYNEAYVDPERPRS
jgi:thiosulfate/3-mercaptopyruvate sulfurtransferase